jgi:hypothetical protein
MNTIPEHTRPWLTQLIIVGAVKDDVVVGSVCAQVEAESYVARCVPEFRRAIEESIAGGNIHFVPKEIGDLARLAAEEMYEIRRLAHLLREGALTTEAIRQNPLYAHYQEYFDESPRVVELAFQIAIHFGMRGGPPDMGRN